MSFFSCLRILFLRILDSEQGWETPIFLFLPGIHLITSHHMERKTIRVVAAVIFDRGKILATQRGYGEWKDWWEFPGGKIEADESPEEALLREIHEELDCGIHVDGLIDTVEYDYPGFHLIMSLYRCGLQEGSAILLLEHEGARWLTGDDLGSVGWLPADEMVLDKVRALL